MKNIYNSCVLNRRIHHIDYTKECKNLLMKCKMFTTPNGVHQSSSLIHNNNGQGPIGVNPMKSVLVHEDTSYYINIEI